MVQHRVIGAALGAREFAGQGFRSLLVTANHKGFGEHRRHHAGAGLADGARCAHHRQSGRIEVNPDPVSSVKGALNGRGHGIAVARRHGDRAALRDGDAAIPHHAGKGSQTDNLRPFLVGQFGALHDAAVDLLQRQVLGHLLRRERQSDEEAARFRPGGRDDAGDLAHLLRRFAPDDLLHHPLGQVIGERILPPDIPNVDRVDDKGEAFQATSVYRSRTDRLGGQVHHCG